MQALHKNAHHQRAHKANETGHRPHMKGATIVFDLDGTLVDTAPDLIGATNHVLKLRSKPAVDPDFARPWISFGAKRMIVESFKRIKIALTDEDLEDLHEKFIIHYEANISATSRPFPSVPQVLDILVEQGAKLALCTNKREHLSRQLLGELGLLDRFQCIVGRDTLPVYKPDPRHLTEAIARAGGDVAQAVMVGDSKTDIDTARAAGVPVIGVSFGYTETPMRDLNPDRMIEHYDDLTDALKQVLPDQTWT